MMQALGQRVGWRWREIEGLPYRLAARARSADEAKNLLKEKRPSQLQRAVLHQELKRAFDDPEQHRRCIDSGRIDIRGAYTPYPLSTIVISVHT